MVTYEIGKPYPHKHHRASQDEIRAVTDHSFFHIVFYSTQPHADAPNWQTGPMRYGLYVKDSIPFFLVYFPKGLAFEVTLNVHSLDDDFVDGWLNSERTLVPMLLMDARTNVILAMRMLSIKSNLAAQLRDCLEKQDQRYPNATSVEVATDALLSQMSVQQMLKAVTLHTA